MRFVEALWLATACVALAGCAAPPVRSPGPAPVIAPAAVVAAAPAPAVETAPAVSAATQRAFDNAREQLRAGRVEEAERAFRALIKSDPQLGGPHANLGIVHRKAGKLDEAVAAFETAVRLSPRQATYFNQLGVTYRLHGKFDKAREAYEKAIALDPGYAAPYLNLGILHDLYLWDSAAALELYDRYLALSPGGDSAVTKWVADLRNRKSPPVAVSLKERP